VTDAPRRGREDGQRVEADGAGEPDGRGSEPPAGGVFDRGSDANSESGTGVTQRFYSRWAAFYDELADLPAVGRLRGAAVDALAPGRGATVLDVGCGTGATLPYLRRAVGPGGRVLGLDFTPGMLAVADERRRRAGWANVHLLRGDAARPPLRDGAVDAVHAAFVDGMLADPDAAVRRWAELVGAGGRLVLVDLARSTGTGRPLNPLFSLFVRATSPPGSRVRVDRSPARTLDARVGEAHRALFDVCVDVTHETYLFGFARVSAGTVERG
jgi:ubiquinone/menaquinone biosynthesis C-methylase UbiE